MNEEICWITNKGKMAKNERENDDFFWALYSVYKKWDNSFFIFLNLFKQRYITSSQSY